MAKHRTIKRVVVLGTSTEVGKTYIGTQLVRAYRQAGGACLALKPIESGIEPGSSGPSGDARALLDAATMGAPPLYAFTDPISPHLAAKRANRHIEVREVKNYVEEYEERFTQQLEEQQREGRSENDQPRHEKAPPPICLIETAGGVFSPLGQMTSNLDLARALDPDAVVLVAPDALGVLHDVQATLRAMSPLVPQMLVLSESRPADASTGTNQEEIKSIVVPQLGLSHLTVLGCRRGQGLDKSAVEALDL